MANILITLIYNMYTIVRRQKDSSVLAYFARESIVYSRGRGVELAYTKGMAYGNYHKYLQV
jgi:hypothetical protein